LSYDLHDNANRLANLSAQNTANHALLNSSFAYGYDPLGLTSGITTTVQGSPSSQSLTHDAAGRLTAVRGAGPTGSWSYDGRGNLTSATSNGVTRSYSYSAGNPEEVASTSISGQPTTY
jgi:YD repeat-containing protein